MQGMDILVGEGVKELILLIGNLGDKTLIRLLRILDNDITGYARFNRVRITFVLGSLGLY